LKKEKKRSADSQSSNDELNHPKKRKRKSKKGDQPERGITREAAAAAAAALVPDYDNGPGSFQQNSESSNSVHSPKGEADDDFDYASLVEDVKEKKKVGRGRHPRVPATVSYRRNN
jgi:hypothetical protein